MATSKKCLEVTKKQKMLVITCLAANAIRVRIGVSCRLSGEDHELLKFKKIRIGLGLECQLKCKKHHTSNAIEFRQLNYHKSVFCKSKK